jgi:hypothetical protein
VGLRRLLLLGCCSILLLLLSVSALPSILLSFVLVVPASGSYS